MKLKKLKPMQRHFTAQDAKVGQKEKEKKEFTLDYHIKDPNQGVVPKEQELQI